jgi:hypothetical protein
MPSLQHLVTLRFIDGAVELLVFDSEIFSHFQKRTRELARFYEPGVSDCRPFCTAAAG